MDDAILRGDLALLEVLDEQIGYVEEKLAALSVDDARIRLLMTMTGIDYFVAMLVLAEIVTIDMFTSDKRFSSWMGLVPRVRQALE